MKQCLPVQAWKMENIELLNLIDYFDQIFKKNAREFYHFFMNKITVFRQLTSLLWYDMWQILVPSVAASKFMLNEMCVSL